MRERYASKIPLCKRQQHIFLSKRFSQIKTLPNKQGENDIWRHLQDFCEICWKFNFCVLSRFLSKFRRFAYKNFFAPQKTCKLLRKKNFKIITMAGFEPAFPLLQAVYPNHYTTESLLTIRCRFKEFKTQSKNIKPIYG